MAGASRRTSICLTGIAVVFVIVIIILCVIPDPCRDKDPRPECRITGSAKSSGILPGDVLTDEPSSTTHPTTDSTSTRRFQTTKTSPTSSSTSTIGSSISSSDDYDYGEGTTASRPSSTNRTTVSTTDKYDATTTLDDTRNTTEDDTVNETGEWSNTTTPVDYDTTNETEGWSTTSSYNNDTSIERKDWSTTTTLDDYDTDNTTGDDTANATDEWSNTTTSVNYDTTNETKDWSTTSSYNNDTSNETDDWSTTTTPVDYDTTETEDLSTTSSYETDNTDPSTTPEPETTVVTTTVSSTTYIPPIMISDGVCDTKACKEVAARMLDTMDHGNVDPCEDFYQYSCGGVMDDLFLKPENAQLPANMLIKKALAKADRNDTDLKELLVVYDSCLNYSRSYTQEERISKIRNVFESLGYKFNPLAVGNVDPAEYPEFKDDFDLSAALARMMKKHFTPFFDFMVDFDHDDATQLVFKMTLPAFTSPFSQSPATQVCYNNYSKNVNEARLKGEAFNISEYYHNEYIKCATTGKGLAARLDRMSAGVEALKLTSHISNHSHSSQLISGARTNLDFMLKAIYENLPPPPEIRRKTLKKDFDIFTLRQLDDGTAFKNRPINFGNFFHELVGKRLNPDATSFHVYFKDILDEIFGIMDSEMSDTKLAQNMMLFLWTESVYGDLVKPVGPEPGSQDYCFNTVSNLMDDYITYLYLKELPNRETLSTQMKHMMYRVKQQLEWQANSAITDIQDKVKDMHGEVAILEEAKEVIQNRGAGEKMTVIKNDFVKNYQNLMENYRKRLYDLLAKGDVEHDTLWSLLQFAYKSSGVTSYALKKFFIPHGAMNPPYYYGSEVPAYINYAGIGHMIAHELMHGFDSTGIKFSESGVIPLSKSVVAQTECLAEEMSATFTRNSSSGLLYVYNLNRELSLDELLADSAATKLAWDTYMRELANAFTAPTISGSLFTLAPSRRRRREIQDLSYSIGGLRNRDKRQASTVGLPGDFQGALLPYLTNYTALQLYYIKTAQNQCSATSEINFLNVMEKEHLPPNLRVNMMLRHDPMFAKAFNCPATSYMTTSPSCQFDPLITDVVGVP